MDDETTGRTPDETETSPTASAAARASETGDDAGETGRPRQSGETRVMPGEDAAPRG